MDYSENMDSAGNGDKTFEPLLRGRSYTWHGQLTDSGTLDYGARLNDGTSAHQQQQDSSTTETSINLKKPSSRRNAWGCMSYADLITKAIESVPEKRLTLSQIYEWMIQNVPYFKDKGETNSSAGWKNSIRHNLSLHRRFVRMQNEGAGKSSWWIVNTDPKWTRNPRRRAESMDTKAYEKKRLRLTKKSDGNDAYSLQTTACAFSPTESAYSPSSNSYLPTASTFSAPASGYAQAIMFSTEPIYEDNSTDNRELDALTFINTADAIQTETCDTSSAETMARLSPITGNAESELEEGEVMKQLAAMPWSHCIMSATDAATESLAELFTGDGGMSSPYEDESHYSSGERQLTTLQSVDSFTLLTQSSPYGVIVGGDGHQVINVCYQTTTTQPAGVTPGGVKQSFAHAYLAFPQNYGANTGTKQKLTFGSREEHEEGIHHTNAIFADAAISMMNTCGGETDNNNTSVLRQMLSQPPGHNIQNLSERKCSDSDGKADEVPSVKNKILHPTSIAWPSPMTAGHLSSDAIDVVADGSKAEVEFDFLNAPSATGGGDSMSVDRQEKLEQKFYDLGFDNHLAEGQTTASSDVWDVNLAMTTPSNDYMETSELNSINAT